MNTYTVWCSGKGETFEDSLEVVAHSSEGAACAWAENKSELVDQLGAIVTVVCSGKPEERVFVSTYLHDTYLATALGISFH